MGELKVIASNGSAVLAVPLGTRTKQSTLAIVWDGVNGWEVPLGAALARGYWEADSGRVEVPTAAVTRWGEAPSR